MDDLLRIGVVTSPHGIKGEVKVYITTDEPERFLQISDLVVDNHKEYRKMAIEDVKYFKNMVILKLSGIHDMDEAAAYRNADLLIHRSQSSPCKEGEYFIADLIGMEVVNEKGEEVGTLTDVYETGANNVYEVTKKNGKQLLLPKIPECILHVDVENKRMQVYVMPGLED